MGVIICTCFYYKLFFILISKEFTKLVLIATIIGLPLAWWAMRRWLDDFAYRVDFSWTIFAYAGLSAIFFALAAVSVQTIKSALANPVKSLRTE